RWLEPGLHQAERVPGRPPHGGLGNRGRFQIAGVLTMLNDTCRSLMLLVAAALAAPLAQGDSSNPVPVTVDNFVRAESDMYFANTAKGAGGLGRLHHTREVATPDTQKVIRTNRDTLYS